MQSWLGSGGGPPAGGGAPEHAGEAEEDGGGEPGPDAGDAPVPVEGSEVERNVDGDAGDDGEVAQEADVAGSDQNPVEGEHDTGGGLHPEKERPEQVELVAHGRGGAERFGDQKPSGAGQGGEGDTGGEPVAADLVGDSSGLDGVAAAEGGTGRGGRCRAAVGRARCVCALGSADVGDEPATRSWPRSKGGSVRPRVVRLVDVGLDEAFDASMSFVQATLRNINAGANTPLAEVEFVRSRDVLTVGSAFTAPAAVLHVMAHGDNSETPTFFSSDDKTEFSIEQLAVDAASTGRAVRTSTILADGCRTGTGAWQRAFRDCLQGPVTYIGTTADVGWHEGTVFASMFYGALFRNRGAGVGPADASAHAAAASAAAYTELLGKKCPYKAVTLQPSRWAKARLN